MIKGVFLGTASIPTVYRNSQGVLLELNNSTTILVDCGEGIQRQMLNRDLDFSKVTTIFLTHHHIDHIYGVGGVLTLLLNKFSEKKIKIYGPNEAIEIVKEIVNLYMPEKNTQIKYSKVTNGQILEGDCYRCLTFKTYHTESSLGYCFCVKNRKIALLGDVAIPNDEAREQIIKSIYQSDVAIIDGVHIAVEEATTIAQEAEIMKLYLMPILIGKTVDEVLVQARLKFLDTYIPDDFEQFELK